MYEYSEYAVYMQKGCTRKGMLIRFPIDRKTFDILWTLNITHTGTINYFVGSNTIYDT